MIPPVTEQYVRGLVELGAEIAGVNPDDVISPCKSKGVSMVRAALSNVLRAQGWQQPRIAEALSRHHSTISLHWTEHELRMMSDENYRYLVERLMVAAPYERPQDHRLPLTVAAQIAELDRVIAKAQELRAQLVALSEPVITRNS